MGQGTRRQSPAVLPLVRGRRAEHLLQRPRPPHRKGSWRSTRLIYDNPITSSIKSFSYRELRDKVAAFAGVLAGFGVGKGDRVIIYMPMIPEAADCHAGDRPAWRDPLGCLRRLCSKRTATRIDDARPKVVDDGVLRHRARDGLWRTSRLSIRPSRLRNISPRNAWCSSDPDEARRSAGRKRSAIGMRSCPLQRRMTVCPSQRPIPSTSCTPPALRQPKGIVRDNGGHLVALKWTMNHVYGVQPGEVYWAASDIGWVVGHSYIVYGPLIPRLYDSVIRRQAGWHAGCRGVWRVISDQT